MREWIVRSFAEAIVWRYNRQVDAAGLVMWYYSAADAAVVLEATLPGMLACSNGF